MNQRSLFLEAMDQPDAAARRRFLDAACPDPALRAKVDALLHAHDAAGSFLSAPAVAVDRLLAMASSHPPTPTPSVPRDSSPKVRVDNVVREFDAETAALLRRRLQIVSLVTALAMSIALIPTTQHPFLIPRLAFILIEALCFVRVRNPRPLSMRWLRRIELLVFGTVAVQITLMPGALMVQSARAGEYSTVVMDAYFVHAVWVLNIVTYGLLIPNTWQRAFRYMFPAGCVPYLSQYLLGLYEPRVQEAFDSLHHGTPFPVVMLAVLEGMVYSHYIAGVRKEVFRAKRFGQYRLKEQLGSGGMGEVYRAEHELLKRDCAIKLIRPGIDADPEAVSRFEKEVRATARLSHWNTVEIYDYGRTDDGTFYYVMELLTGLSFADLVRLYGPMPPGRAVYLLSQVCDALREAHEKGLIHRDIKPANIFAATRGGVPDVAKLLDFGLVRQVSGGEEPAESASISGSPAYMAPEQGLLGGVSDARSDLYALGAVAYFLLTGRPPFDGHTILEQIVAHTKEPVVPPSRRGVDVPADLERVVLRCLSKAPGARYPDAASLKRALLDCACASDWNADCATAWWAARPDAVLLSSGIRSAKKVDRSVAVIDATVDLRGGS